MRGILATAFGVLLASGAAAQTIHPGLVERWYLALGPLHEARSCIASDDPLRPGLDSLLHDVQAQAMRGIPGDYEKGMLAGRLAVRLENLPSQADDAACERILAHVARGLLRVHAR
jgi:hypothetical protein